MRSLSQTLVVVPDSDNDGYHNYDFEDQELEDAKMTALREIERHQRMDQWVPSYQNIISETALEVRMLCLFYNLERVCAYSRGITLDQKKPHPGQHYQAKLPGIACLHARIQL